MLFTPTNAAPPRRRRAEFSDYGERFKTFFFSD